MTGWPKKETSLPTDFFTKKELDIRGARTSAGEFEEAMNLMLTGKVDMTRLLTSTIAINQVPEILTDMEKNHGKYMKVVVTF